MGGAPSVVQNNHELVQYLLQNRYVRRKEVEIVFRAVDRADYVLPSHQESAYNDLAWKHGNLHLSAPCVYAVALEFLSLKSGQSFLNIGSGTGYFSTMAGLLLGPYGVNHGIELHEDCIHYARDRLENFKQKSQTLEEFEFCEPYFVRGNCLRVVPTREYDTVYCGAAVSENNIVAVKRFVKIGGSIVMPYKGRLCCFKRLTETGWRRKKSLGVSFATLVTPDVAEQNAIALPGSEPLSLQELCRSEVRQILRKNIWTEHPELGKRNLSLPYRQPRSDSPFGQSEEEGSNDDEDEDEDEDDDEEEEEEDDEEDDETDGHIIRRTRFLFNMEADSNEPAGNPLLLSQRVAMLVRQRIGGQQQRAEALLGRISEEVRNDPPTAAGGASTLEQDGSPSTADNQSMDTSSNLNGVGLSLNDRPDFWGSSGQADSNTSQQPSSERNTRDSESGRDSEYDSDDDRLTQWRKIPKRENTDSGIVDDVNVPYDDTNSSFNVGHTDSEEAEDSDDMDVDLSSVALRETFRQVCEGRNKIFGPRQPLPRDDTAALDSAESRLFVTRMKEKIQLLPLPTKLKIYMNHNRNPLI